MYIHIIFLRVKSRGVRVIISWHTARQSLFVRHAISSSEITEKRFGCIYHAIVARFRLCIVLRLFIASACFHACLIMCKAFHPPPPPRKSSLTPPVIQGFSVFSSLKNMFRFASFKGMDIPKMSHRPQRHYCAYFPEIFIFKKILPSWTMRNVVKRRYSQRSYAAEIA